MKIPSGSPANGNGLAYFRKSPWASSDILVTLLNDLAPESRGLLRDGGNPVWQVATDYLWRLKRLTHVGNLSER